MITARQLNEALTDDWPHGPIASVTATRIGEEHGFLGEVNRLQVTTTDGSRHSLVAKRETPEQIERVVFAYQEMSKVLAGRVPALFGFSDAVTVFEEVAPATQGDGLDVKPCQVEPLIGLLAHLHRRTWLDSVSDIPENAPAWNPTEWEESRWSDRIRLAAERYDATDELINRLWRLHEEVPGAIERLRDGPVALVHGDVGFDNTLWRPNGDVVLLDWSTARIGPPATDVADLALLLDADTVIDSYLAITRFDRGVFVRWMVDALTLLVRGIVGFAGFPDEPRQRRLRAFRDRAMTDVERTLSWLDENEQKSA